MTKKYDEFIADLKLLLEKHNVYLSRDDDQIYLVNGYVQIDKWFDALIADDTKD